MALAAVEIEVFLHAAQPPADGAGERVRKKKSRWEEPAPSTAVALVNVPKEITLPGGIKVNT